MNPFPAEMWIQIYAAACIDTGTTAQSLALVCKTSYRLVQQFKLQSLAFLRPNELVKFSMYLGRIPPEHREMKYLYIALESLWVDGQGSRELVVSPSRYVDQEALCAYLDALNPFASESAVSDRARIPESVAHVSSTVTDQSPTRIRLQDRHIQKALYLTLNLASPTLVILSIHLAFVTRKQLLPAYSFPKLEELTIYGSCTPNAGELEGLDGLSGCSDRIVRYPALKRLHLSQTFAYSIPLARDLAKQAPHLTHLYLNLRSYSLDGLASAMGLLPHLPDASRRNGKFPTTLRIIYLETDPHELVHAGSSLDAVLERTEEINALSGLDVKICSRPPGKWADIGSALVDWEDRINGREGRWEKGVYSLNGRQTTPR
ncbi:hypothetical protein E1B28_011103 [Marasmius oreades]|uniref:Uncharacterized protein n=1 Tax=Marasmius oreades TaxID=181124 RepID=A0A9P7RTI1_9AGAR|nr:uncharacterized protein E1B28_011103 [Marasmius oreades]KAG7089415.1 hypothetical protein E1B28_011103 [Marasmius oreades]